MGSEDIFSILGAVFPNRVRVILSDGKLVGLSGGYTVGTLQQIGAAIEDGCPNHSNFESPTGESPAVANLTRLAMVQTRPAMIVRYLHLSHRPGLPCHVIALTTGPCDAIDELPTPSIAPLPLTDQEMSLAQNLVAGRSLQEIADAKGCSIHTVRNQLKSALRAVQAHSQGQLAFLVRDWLI